MCVRERYTSLTNTRTHTRSHTSTGESREVSQNAARGRKQTPTGSIALGTSGARISAKVGARQNDVWLHKVCTRCALNSNHDCEMMSGRTECVTGSRFVDFVSVSDSHLLAGLSPLPDLPPSSRHLSLNLFRSLHLSSSLSLRPSLPPPPPPPALPPHSHSDPLLLSWQDIRGKSTRSSIPRPTASTSRAPRGPASLARSRRISCRCLSRHLLVCESAHRNMYNYASDGLCTCQHLLVCWCMCSVMHAYEAAC